MAATALLKFRQGATIGPNGQALVVSAGTACTIENSSNTDVDSWEVYLLDGPPGSTFEQTPGTPALLASGTGGSAPTTTITPQTGFPGSYRVQLVVRDALGNQDTDIRNLIVVTPNLSLVIPPYQRKPSPLDLNTKPEEMNIGGQPWGWSGGEEDPSHRLLRAALLKLDELAGKVKVSATDTTAETLESKLVGDGVSITKLDDTGREYLVLTVLPVEKALIGAPQKVTFTGYSRIGGFVFDGSAYTDSVTFTALLETTNASVSADVILYNVTDSSVVAGSALSSTSLIPEEQAVVLDIPADLPSAEKVYEVHLKMGAAGSGTDAVTCLWAKIG